MSLLNQWHSTFQYEGLLHCTCIYYITCSYIRDVYTNYALGTPISTPPPPPPINWHNKRNSRSFFLSFFSIVKYKSWYKSPPGTLESLPGQNQNYNQVRNSVKTLILPDIWFLNLLTPHPIVFKNYIFSLSRKHAPLFEQTVFNTRRTFCFVPSLVEISTNGKEDENV